MIGALVKSLLSMKLKTDDTKSVRGFVDLLQSRVRSLEGQGFDVENEAAQLILIPLFEEKLTTTLFKEWELEANKIDDSKITTAFFFSFMDRQVMAMEATERTQQKKSKLRPEAEPFDDEQDFSLGSLSTSATLVGQQARNTTTSHTTTNQPQPKTPYFGPRPYYQLGYVGYRPTQPGGQIRSFSPRNECAYCHKFNHQLESCRQFADLPIESKWLWIQSSRKCYNCLEAIYPGHNSTSCSKPSCTSPGCSHKHHTLLHPPYTNPTVGTLGNIMTLRLL